MWQDDIIKNPEKTIEVLHKLDVHVGVKINPEDGIYNISNVTSNLNITVENVTKNTYSVSVQRMEGCYTIKTANISAASYIQAPGK